VAAGTYTVKMIKGADAYRSSFTLAVDPGSRHTDADRAVQQDVVRALYAMVERLAYLSAAVTDARSQAQTLVRKVPEKSPLRKRIQSLADEFERRRTSLAASQRGEGISGEQKLREEIGGLYGNVNGYDGRPTASQTERMGVLSKDLDSAMAVFDTTLSKEGAAVNTQLTKLKLAPLVKLTREAWDGVRQ
jgi:hypothetical protein